MKITSYLLYLIFEVILNIFYKLNVIFYNAMNKNIIYCTQYCINFRIEWWSTESDTKQYGRFGIWRSRWLRRRFSRKFQWITRVTLILCFQNNFILLIGIVCSGYDPAAFRDLPVSSEIQDIFKFIERYQPQTIELDFKLKPFIPDYIPSIGDIDAFLKVNRPDGKEDNLGFIVVDEPSSNQSDPHVLDLFFRTL